MASARSSLTLAALGLLLAAPAFAQAERRPIDPSQLPRWTDAGGFIWDPGMLGEIQDGSTDTFDGAFRLTVQGMSADMLVSQATSMGDFGRVFGMEGETLVIGPLPVTGGLEVTQRLGLTADRRALRTILTFRNTSSEAVDVQASYFHDLGITVSDTSEVAVDSGEGTWAVTMRQDAMRCTVVQIYGDRRGPDGMTVGRGRAPDEVTVGLPTISVPGQAKVSVALFAFQLPPGADTSDLTQSFSASEALADLDPDLRNTVVNAGGGGRASNVSLPKEEGVDLLTLRSGSLLKGKLLTEQLQLRCAVGTLTLPTARLDGLVRQAEDGASFLVASLDGQVYAGQVLTPTLAFELGSRTVTVPIAKLESLSYRPVELPEEPTPAPRMLWVGLTSGDRWRIEALASPITFVTRYGSINVATAGLGRLTFRQRNLSTHHLALGGGSLLNGVVAEQQLSLVLSGGREVTLPTSRVEWVGTVDTPDGGGLIGAFHVTGLGDDRLVGTLPAGAELALQTELGPVRLAFREVRKVSRTDERAARVRVTLWSGSALDGELANPFTLRLDEGTELSIDPLSCAELEQPQPALSPEEETAVLTAIQMLDAGAFDVRERAHAALLEMGASIRPYIRQALDKPDISFEQRERLKSILSNLERE